MKTKEQIEEKYNTIREKFYELDARDDLNDSEMEKYYALDYGVYILQWVLDL
jgi:hypothetical protein